MTPKKKGLAVYLFIGIIFGWLGFCFFVKTGNYMTLNPDVKFLEAMETVMNSRLLLPTGLFPILEKGQTALWMFLCASVILALLAVVEIEKNKRTAPGIESGSASWNEKLRDYNKHYVDTVKKGAMDTNMILSQQVKLSMDTRKTGLNDNCIVVGGAVQVNQGYCKPNILQQFNYIARTPRRFLLMQKIKRRIQ